MITPFLLGILSMPQDLSIPELIPSPRQVERQAGRFALDPTVSLIFDEREAPRRKECSTEAHAHVLAEEIEWLTGVRLPVARAGTADGRVIELLLDSAPQPFAVNEALEQHSYRLDVSPERIQVRAPYLKGLTHGTATLLQALVVEGSAGFVPSLSILDEPTSAYRAVMIDVARKPHSIGVLEDVIRLARLYKLRYVHLHLTDDQHFAFPFTPVTSKLKNNAAYTRQQLVDLVAYADVRGVTLIPEIDLPGHSSRLIESGYLPKAENHADVAGSDNFERIHALLDEVLAVFASSPYLHIGGDESGAGEALVPFLASMQAHVRKRDRRLIVWEGFRGAPTDVLPARGEDRILVAAWESSYNPPWELLEAGYELVNASWKPLYVVGGGSLVHPGSSAGRKWTAREIADWDKDSFWHWEPGRPVFEDRGPNDPDRTDSAWSAAYIGRESQVIGSQICVWEQRESSVTESLRQRIPVFAERVWSGSRHKSAAVITRMQAVDERVWPLVQPIEILPTGDRQDPLIDVYRAYEGEELDVRIENRSSLSGSIRYELEPFSGRHTYIRFPELDRPSLESETYDSPVTIRGGFAVRAQLYDRNGRARGGGAWARYLNWPDRVRVTEFELDRHGVPGVPDLASFADAQVRRRYTLPMIRGPLDHVAIKAQRFDATLLVPEDGTYVFSMKTQSGRASFYLDRDGNGQWSSSDRLISETPNTEELQQAQVDLLAGSIALRVDHVSGLPRPVVLVYLEGPGTKGREEITRFLQRLD